MFQFFNGVKSSNDSHSKNKLLKFFKLETSQFFKNSIFFNDVHPENIKLISLILDMSKLSKPLISVSELQLPNK